MLIKQLSIRIKRGFSAATFAFSPKTTLVYSDKNSTGKSTLMRALVYALGEDVPGTTHFDFSDHEFKLDLVAGDNQPLRILRQTGKATVLRKEANPRLFSLPSELPLLRQEIYGIQNERVLDNLLAAWFIEQDSGWLTLNRGHLVGTKLPFSLKSFVAGLSERDLSAEEFELAELSRQIKMIRVVLKAMEYSATALGEVVKQPHGDQDAETPNATLRDRQNELVSMKSSLLGQLHQVQSVLDDNQRFAHYIEELKLQIIAPNGDIVPVTSNNLRGYCDNQDCLLGRANVLRSHLAAVNQELRKLNSLIAEDPALFDLATNDLEIEKVISATGLDHDELEGRLSSLKKRKAQLQERYNESISTEGNAVAQRLASIIGDFAEQLGESDYFRSLAKGIYAAQFNDKTGAHHQLLAFAFRMGYAKIIEELYGLELPLVIDSPRGRELDVDNVKKIAALLRREFANHQVIVASIYEEGFEDAEGRIVLSDRIEERTELVTDQNMWAYEGYLDVDNRQE